MRGPTVIGNGSIHFISVNNFTIKSECNKLMHFSSCKYCIDSFVYADL